MTPYAVLLVKPNDTDELIRKSYHVLAEQHHPDANHGEPGSRWYEVSAAYNAIKTPALREAQERGMVLLANFCLPCKGSGVQGTRMFRGKITVCSICKGAGVVKG